MCHAEGRNSFQGSDHWRRIALVPKASSTVGQEIIEIYLPFQSFYDLAWQLLPGRLCIPRVVFYQGRRCRRCVEEILWWGHQGSKTLSSVSKIRQGWWQGVKFSDLGDHECLDFSCVGDVRPDTQVNHGTTAINCRRCSIGNLWFYEVLLIFVVLNISLVDGRWYGMSVTHVEHLE